MPPIIRASSSIASARLSTATGVILGIDDESFYDQGGYVRTHAATVPDLAAAMLPGPYRFPAYRATTHMRLTNKTPCGTYRAPGRFESTFVRERLMDAIAHKLGLDRIEVRRRNLIGKEQMPYARALDTLGTEIILDSATTPVSWTKRSTRSTGRNFTARWRSDGRRASS